jgi:hypothetical protein
MLNYDYSKLKREEEESSVSSEYLQCAFPGSRDSSGFLADVTGCLGSAAKITRLYSRRKIQGAKTRVKTVQIYIPLIRPPLIECVRP